LVSSSSGQLRHITEEQYEDAVTDEPSNSMSEEPCNDASDASLHYFARVSNHYLSLVKSSSPVDIRHMMQYPIIVNSGANFHMFCALDFFESITPMSGKVILGDGKTTLDIHGIGTVKLCFGNQSLCLENVRCVPDLAESIYSLFIHIQSPGCAVHSSYDDGLSIIFPEFITKALIGYNDIYLNATPKPKLSGSQPLNSSGDNSHHSDIASTLCCHMSDFQCALTSESTKVDNILHRLHQYYQDVKTRRQLDLEVPAGFRQQSNHQRLLSIHPVPVVENISSGDAPEQIIETSSMDVSVCPDSVTNLSSQLPVPILRCVDKPSSSLTSKITYTEDFVSASVGCCRIDSIKNKLSDLYQNTIAFDSLPPDAVLDNGNFSTLHKTPRNNQAVPRP